MHLYTVVLAAHIAVLLFAFALTGVIHSCEWLMLRAGTVQEMRVLARPLRWGVLFTVVVAALLGLGGWLVKLSDDRAAQFSVKDGWVWTAVVVLVLAFAAGAGLEGPHAERLNKELAEAPDGAPSPEITALATSTVAWVVGHAVTFMVVGVMVNMVNKPGAPVAVLVIAVGALLGGLLGLVGSRRQGLP